MRIIFSLIICLFIFGCTQEVIEEPELIEEPEPELVEEEIKEEELTDPNWCLEERTETILGLYKILGIEQDYVIEGKTYEVCHDKRWNDKGILVQERWYNYDESIKKEVLIDSNNVHEIVTNFYNQNGLKCIRIIKEEFRINDLSCN
jgi:hypothetical protein